MTIYNTGIPIVTDRPSADVPLMQANFSIVNTTMGTNHVPMTNATIADRGKHNLVTMPTQGSEPTPAVALTEGSIYTIQATNSPQVAAPVYRTGSGGSKYIYSLPVCIQVNNVTVNNSSTNIFNFSGLAALTGVAFAYQISMANRTLMSPFVWDGTTLSFPGSAGQLPSGSDLIKFTSSGTNVQMNVNSGDAPYVLNVRFIGAIM